MAPLPSDLKIRLPEFASLADATVQVFLDDAALSVNECVFDEKTDLAIIYLAAHLLSTIGGGGSGGGGGGGSSGPVTSEKVGDIQRSYGTVSSSSSSSDNSTGNLFSTRYGQTFLRLREECVLKPVLVTPGGGTKVC